MVHVLSVPDRPVGTARSRRYNTDCKIYVFQIHYKHKKRPQDSVRVPHRIVWFGLGVGLVPY